MNGQVITRLATLGSCYDDGHLLNAWDDRGKMYRISTKELLKLFNNVQFSITKKRKYEHLTIQEVSLCD